jgi:hypothetical protein
MDRDGKIIDGEGWVFDLDHAPILVAVLERWVFLHGDAPVAPDIEYDLEHQ